LRVAIKIYEGIRTKHNVFKHIGLKLLERFGYTIIRLPFLSKEYENIINSVRPYTITPWPSIVTLLNSIEYIVKNEIPGSIVECGVWKGGSIMAATKMLLNLNCTNREIYLFDTFEGMTKPDEIDRKFTGIAASEEFEKKKINEDSSDWM